MEEIAHGDRVAATMYDGQTNVIGKVITVDRAHGLALIRVEKVSGTWPYPPKIGETPRVALHNCRVLE